MALTQGGVLAEKDEPEALAAGVLSLIDRPEARRDIGRHARERVEALFSWRRVAAETAECYAELLDSRRGRPTRTITSA